jgi:uncharacterized membrane protein
MADDDHPVTELTVFAVLGAGFVALFLGVEWFWMIWVLGFAVVLPAVGILVDRYPRSGEGSTDGAASESEDDALETLRERYASGDLGEAEFERRVERLLETEDRETAAELGVEADRADRDRDTEFER